MAAKDDSLHVRLDKGDNLALSRLENAMKKNRSDIARIAIHYLLDTKVANGDVAPLQEKEADYDAIIDGIKNLMSKKSEKHVSLSDFSE